MKHLILKRPLFIAFGIAVIIVGAVGSFLYHNRSTGSQAPARAEPVAKELQKMIARVGTHTELPQGEEPVVATITDLGGVRENPFFTGASVGDIVLIYKAEKKVILYKPRSDQVINEGSFADANLAEVSGASVEDGQTRKSKVLSGTPAVVQFFSEPVLEPIASNSKIDQKTGEITREFTINADSSGNANIINERLVLTQDGLWRIDDDGHLILKYVP